MPLLLSICRCTWTAFSWPLTRRSLLILEEFLLLLTPLGPCRLLPVGSIPLQTMAGNVYDSSSCALSWPLDEARYHAVIAPCKAYSQSLS